MKLQHGHTRGSSEFLGCLAQLFVLALAIGFAFLELSCKAAIVKTIWNWLP